MREILFLCYDQRELVTRIYRTEYCLTMQQKPLSLIQEWCLTYGSSYEGRINAIRHSLSCGYKLPVLIQDQLFLFPTRQPNQADCLWINAMMLREIKERCYGSDIIFLNGYTLSTKESYRFLKRQWMRCKEYYSIMKSNNNPHFIA